MSVPRASRGLPVALALLAALAAASCAPRPLARQFEYEEDITLALDGSATVVVNTSVPALVALRGLPLPVSPRARFDRGAVRALFEGPGIEVTRVSRPWRRRGRRFFQVRLVVDDVRRLAEVAPFAWSAYEFEREDGVYVYRQTLAAPAGHDVGDVGWTGDELVAVRLHVPSRIVYHNAPSRTVERGNILTWEQPLRDRLAGSPLAIEVRMETASILSRTLAVFGGAAAAALLLLAAAVGWVWHRGRAARAGAARPDN